MPPQFDSKVRVIEPEAPESDGGAATTQAPEAPRATADLVTWYLANQKDLSLPLAEDAVLEGFDEEVLVPMGEMPAREKLLRLLDVYGDFHRAREDVRARRRQLRASMPQARLDRPPLDSTFDEEYTLMRGLLDALVLQLTQAEYVALVRSEHWKPLCKLIGRDE